MRYHISPIYPLRDYLGYPISPFLLRDSVGHLPIYVYTYIYTYTLYDPLKGMCRGIQGPIYIYIYIPSKGLDGVPHLPQI